MEGLRTDQQALERTGPPFHAEGMLVARRRTWQAVHAIAARLAPGMTEDEGQRIAAETLRELGTTRLWHRSHVRFGVNTLKPYGSPSEPGVVLGENDLFFVDIGPVWDGFEGDAGATFQTGSDPERAACIAAGRTLHGLVRAKWESERLSGAALYAYAQAEARRMGWVLTLEEANGHRLSDFPHALYFRGGISELAFAPTEALWVLEIQIRHPSRPFGAFHEDLLVSDPSDPFTTP